MAPPPRARRLTGTQRTVNRHQSHSSVSLENKVIDHFYCESLPPTANPAKQFHSNCHVCHRSHISRLQTKRRRLSLPCVRYRRKFVFVLVLLTTFTQATSFFFFSSFCYVRTGRLQCCGRKGMKRGQVTHSHTSHLPKSKQLPALTLL